MKKENVKELFKKASVKVSSLVLAAAVLAGSSAWYENTHSVPELVTFVDADSSVLIEADEVPLASSKTTKSTKTTKKTKNVKLKTASKKTYTQTGKTKKKTTTKKTTTSKDTTTTKTETATTVSNKFTKGSKIKKETTTVKTTVTKTVVTKTAASSASARTVTKDGAVSVASIAPKADKRVLNSFTKLGFQVNVKSSVAYAGLCDARTRTITLKKVDDTIYHELGHYVAFVAGNVDMSSAFKAVYNSEKSKYTAYNKAYVLQNSSEYFAESFKNYTENPAALKTERPKTYAAIVDALNKITDSQVNKIATVYSAVWK